MDFRFFYAMCDFFKPGVALKKTSAPLRLCASAFSFLPTILKRRGAEAQRRRGYFTFLSHLRIIRTSHFFCLLLSFLCCSTLFADTRYDVWGVDKDMIQQEKNSDAPHKPAAGFEAIIAFHQQIISQADGPRSHFIPSSSEYMKRAMQKYGFFWGYILGCDRLMRENEEKWIWGTYKTKDGHFLKIDPVP